MKISKIMSVIIAVSMIVTLAVPANVYADEATSTVEVWGHSLKGLESGSQVSDVCSPYVVYPLEDADGNRPFGTSTTVQIYQNDTWTDYTKSTFDVGTYRLKIHIFADSACDKRYKFVSKPTVTYNDAVCKVENLQTYALNAYTDPAFTVTPATEYPLLVAGKTVTSVNAADILGDGVFKYHADTKTLNVKGDCTNNNGSVIKNNGIQGLTIDIISDSTLTSPGSSAIFCAGNDTRITGRGKLTVNSTDFSGIFARGNNVTLTIEGANIIANGKSAISANGDSEKLVIKQSYIEANGTEQAINGFGGGITVEDCKITTPDKAVISGGKIYESNGTTPAKTVKTDYVYYGLDIAGNKVTDKNAGNILGDGVFAYDPETKTLTVNGSCNIEKGNVIDNVDVSGLTIDVTGDSELSSHNGAVIYIEYYKNSTAITSSNNSKLQLHSYTGADIYTHGALIIKNAYIDVLGIRGISCASLQTLRIINSYVHADTTYCAIGGFEGGIDLIGCSIVSPQATVDKNGTIYPKGSNTEAAEVIVEPAEYALKIADIPVTTLNAKNIDGDGVFSYDAETKTLTVNGICMTLQNSVIENTGIDGLTINVEGDSSLTSAGNTLMCNSYNTKITGKGKLSLNSNGSCAIFLNSNCILTIEDADVTLNGAYGITGMPSVEQLTVKNSTVTANCTKAAISDLGGGITLEGCDITSPEGAVNQYGNIYEQDGNAVAKNVTIQPPLEEYGLNITGTSVTNRNASDILGDGVFSYDPETKTLTVNGICTTQHTCVIENTGIDGLTINVEGDSSLTSAGNTLMCNSYNTKITGKGKLSLNSDGFCAIFLNSNCILTIEDADVTLNGAYGITGMPSVEQLTVKNSTVTANCTKAAISDLGGGITLEGCAITSPDGAVNQNGTIYEQDGNTAAKKVTIQPKLEKYGLTIAGTSVTNKNAPDILGDGVFSYDAKTKTLTVNGSCTYDHIIIDNLYLEGLTINVTGDSTLTSKGTAISCPYDTTITGSGKLTVIAGSCCIYAAGNPTLTIENADVTLLGAYGIMGMPHAEKLIIKNSAVNIDCTSPAISDFGGGITLEGCHIDSPENALNKGGTVYESNGTDIAKKVTISIGGGNIEPHNEFPYGDASGNGQVAADDAAFVLQKVLLSTFKMPIEDKTADWEKIVDVSANGTIAADDAAIILQKVLLSTFEMPCEAK